MKKQILSFICGAVVALGITMVPAVADSISKSINVLVDYVTVTLDGEKVDVKNFVHDGSTYLGLRDMGNLLGLQVDWDERTRTAVLTSPGKTPVFPAGPMQTIEIPIVKPTTMKINDNVIDSEWITNQYNLYKANYPDANAELIKQAIVDDATFDTFTKEMFAKYNVTFNKDDYREEAEADYLAFADSYGGLEALQLLLASNNMDPEAHKADYLESYYKTAMSNKLTDTLIANNAEIKAFVDEKKAEFEKDKTLKTKTVATVKHILIPDSETAEADAKKVLSRLKKGEKFDKLLAEFNNDPGQPETGYEVSINSGFVPEFEEAAVKLQKGKYSELVKTDYGYHILYCLDTKEEEVLFDNYLNENFGQDINGKLNAIYQTWYDAADRQVEWGF